MCSCFDQSIPPQLLHRAMRLGSMAELPKKKRIRPTDPTLVLGARGQWRMLAFGWPVSWSSRPLLNGRIETLSEKAAFVGALEQRVIVPAAFYVEWKDAAGIPPEQTAAPTAPAAPSGQKTRKIAHSIGATTGDPLLMAALWDGAGAVCIVTTKAVGPAAEIHDRMPLLLDPEQARDQWLAAMPYAQVRQHIPLCDGQSGPWASRLTVAPLGDTVEGGRTEQGTLFGQHI